MSDRIFKRFPDCIETVKTHLKNDPTFREICADYEEMCAWFECYCRSTGLPSKECDYAREVIKELEDEIIRALDAETRPKSAPEMHIQ